MNGYLHKLLMELHERTADAGRNFLRKALCSLIIFVLTVREVSRREANNKEEGESGG